MASSDHITLDDLQHRWETALSATAAAVRREPEAYRSLKALITDVLRQPLDIRDYLSTAKTLEALLATLDPEGPASIFHHFKHRISPTDIWQVNLLRMECRDLLAHLEAFDAWRRKHHRLTVVK